MMMIRTLREYIWLEAQSAPRRAPIGLALGGAFAVALSHLLIPRMPERVISFMELGFRLEGMAAVLLLNDIVAVYFAAFFAGAAGLLESIVAAREEHRLEILLAKPIPPAIFLGARTLPVLASSVAAGVLVAIACAAALVPFIAEGGAVTVLGALGAGLFVTGIALVELAALAVVLVRMRDSFYGLLVAAMLWLLSMMPAAVLLYRPDLFEGRDTLASAITLPSLLWNDGTTVWLGPLALACAVPVAALLVRAAGHRLARTDAM